MHHNNMERYSLLKQQEHAHDDGIWTLCWLSQNELITGSLDTTAKVWEAVKQEEEARLVEKQVFDGFTLGVVSIDVAPASKVVAFASMDSKIRLFDLDESSGPAEVKTIDAGPVDSWRIKFSPDGKHIATGGLAGKINLYSTNVDGDTTKTQFDVGKFAYSVDFSPDGRLLVAGNLAGTIFVFDLEGEKMLTQINGHAMPVRAVAFSPDSKLILSGSDDTQIKILAPDQVDPIKTLCGHGSWIQDLSFSPDGTSFASASTDKKVKVWDMTNYECLQTFAQHTGQVTGVRYNSDGSLLASVSEDSSIIVYDQN